MDSNKLNRNNKGMEIIYLQKCLKSIQGIKSESGLELEPKELRDLNTSIKSIETK